MSFKLTLDTLLDSAVNAGEVPGVIAMVTDRHRTLYQGAFGKRALGEAAPMTLDSVGWIASMTKALTSAAAMQLVERGAVDLDAPVSRWLPAIDAAQVLDGFEPSGIPILRAPKRAITLRHLLSHTSGYGYDMWSDDLLRYQAATSTPRIGSGKQAALHSPLLFDPGERWCYGIGVDWAGRLVEEVSGQKLGAYLKHKLLGPLGMRDTAFRLTPSMRSRLVTIHRRGDDGMLLPMVFEVEQEPENQGGGGGLYGTVGDYLKFVRMVLNCGRAGEVQVLKPETVDLMSRNALGDLRVTLLRHAMPALTHDAEFFPGAPKSWGLGFQINEEPVPTGRCAGGLMWAGLANSYFWIDPKRGVGGVYLTQILPFADPKSLSLYLAFESAVYGAINQFGNGL